MKIPAWHGIIDSEISGEDVKIMNNTENINGVILQKISEIEEKENVRILHCVESGSRAWGFASPDSDYDVRFVYVRKPEFYLKLEKTSDVIEWQLDEVLDINGWDLQKALRLLHKSNAALFEWNNSPIVYKTTDTWAAMRDTVNSCFSVKPCLYHYLNIAKTNYKSNLQEGNIKLKKYLYVIRAVLACKWILNKETPPPVLFSELAESELESDVKPIINRLLAEKSESGETDRIKRIPPLDDYIAGSLEAVQKRLDSMEDGEVCGWDKLNKIFLSALSQN